MPAIEGPILQSTFLALNPARLGSAYSAVRAAVETTIDLADLTRFFVRTPSAPMRGLLPPPLDASPAPVAVLPQGPSEPMTPPVKPQLYVDASNEDHRSVAERIQVMLHPRGIALVVRPVPRTEFVRRIASKDYDLAIVGMPAFPESGLALAQVVHFTSGRDLAAQELAAIGKLPDPSARRAFASARAHDLLGTLPLVPLYASGVRMSIRAGVYGAEFDAAGVPSLADLWKWEAK
jgi:MarR-like DNA-binding transcriptional regulator SgrR of sgrS sRNA